PLVMYLNLVPALLARFTAMHIIFAFDIVMCAVAAASLVACCYVIARGFTRPDWRVLGPFLFAIGALNLALPHDFGQRAHVFVLAYLPFFLLRQVRYGGGAVPRGAAVMLGLAASIGFCLSPFDATIPVAVEIYWILKTRTLKRLSTPEIAAGCTFALAYA